MKTIEKLESKEPNKEEIQKILKQNLLKIFSQIKKGCMRKICYNMLCANNIVCKNSNYFFYIFPFYRNSNIKRRKYSKKFNRNK